jgi:phage terminase large subunit-like protein
VPLFEAKRVYFPMTHGYTDTEGVNRDMVHTFIEDEMLAFPAAAHDDMLDGLAVYMFAFGWRHSWNCR